jgi:hypothetical protein
MTHNVFLDDTRMLNINSIYDLYVNKAKSRVFYDSVDLYIYEVFYPAQRPRGQTSSRRENLDKTLYMN